MASGWGTNWSFSWRGKGVDGLRWREWMWRLPLDLRSLQIEAKWKVVGCGILSRSVEIHAAHYRTGSLTVAPRFVEPDPEELKRIKAEAQAEGEGVCGECAVSRFGAGTFARLLPRRRPTALVPGACSTAKLASIHKGMDFHAPVGTPVRAGNQRRGGAGAAALLRGELRGCRSRTGACTRSQCI